MQLPDLLRRFANDGIAYPAVASGSPRRFSIVAALLVLPSVAHARIDLSAPPPTDLSRSGPSVTLGRVGLDPCPGGYCRPDPEGNLFYFMTPHSRPIEPVPGIVLHIPFGSGDR